MACPRDVLQPRQIQTDALPPLYRSSNGKVNVGGTMVRGSETSGTAHERLVFEVGRIGRLVVTAIRFDPDPLFDRRDERYNAGIICSI
jgi:hypothetical protein